MPITREEKLLNTLATGVASGVSPITREEQYLSYIAGETYTKPDAPITRKEAFLDKIPQGGGGGSGVTIKNQNKTITENGTYTADSGYTGLGTVTVDVQASGETGGTRLYTIASGEYTSAPNDDYYGAFVSEVEHPYITNCATRKYRVVFDGEDLGDFTPVEAIGLHAIGNLSIVNALGFNFEDTNEPFVAIVGNENITLITNTAESSTHSIECSVYISNSLPARLVNNDVIAITAEELEGATKIRNYAFYYCDSLIGITIPESVTSIGSHAFYECFYFASAILPEGLTSIYANAFYRCTRMTNITIPSSVTLIGGAAFYNCLALTSITCLAETPPTLGTNAFYNVPVTYTIYVPAASVDAYKVATNWSSLADHIQAIAE